MLQGREISIMKIKLFLGIIIAALLGFSAILAPLIVRYDPLEMNLDSNRQLNPPSLRNIFGTDNLGRDVFSRMVYGGRVSMSVGFTAVFISVFIGVILGALSGYYGGWVDYLITRLIEIMYCMPVFFLIMLVITFIGPGIFNVMIVIGLTSWPGIARLVRGEFLTLRERDFVLSARLSGASSARIIFKHILPNALHPVYVSFALGIGSSILTESALSFLGMGVQIPTASWGNILSGARSYIDHAWWLFLFPGIAIFLSVFAFNLIGESLREIYEPKIGD
ncbi:oligopeptide ABC transporter permease [Candidatus Omnitrophus magneticus]|uniref:Oligopeptide ABC transporter permease n=1 Tax=Candidatus Omnitrophus magneticus TaxID=1609969 RepID=A0A0F0CQ39_9BACT|nr:oligopeptide ABC transporter permease [Candidatus Omnitrophus magneticus]